MDCVVSTSVAFILSATPFCSGVFGTVSSCLTPPLCRPQILLMCTHRHCWLAGLSVYTPFIYLQELSTLEIAQSQFQDVHPHIASLVINEC